MTDYMCLVYLKDNHYLVDTKAFYLLCSLQEVKFGYEDIDDYVRDDEKMRMFKITLDWLIDQKRAIKLARAPTHLIIKFKDD